MSDTLRLRSGHWEVMRRDCQERRDEEACGLVAGSSGESVEVFPAANAAHSPVSFYLDPVEQIRLLDQIEAVGWDLLAIYHSHPNGPPVPSATDLRQHVYPESAALIWAPGEGGWDCRAFWIRDGEMEEIPVVRINEGE